MKTRKTSVVKLGTLLLKKEKRDMGSANYIFLLDIIKYLSYSEVQKNSKVVHCMFLSCHVRESSCKVVHV